MKIYYENILVGEVITNRSLTINEALELIDFNESDFIAANGFDDIDYGDFRMDYSVNTVKLHLVQSQSNDPTHRTSYVIEGNAPDIGWIERWKSFVNEAEEYDLPAGYNVAKSNSDTIEIYDDKDNRCEIDRLGNTPRLSSASGTVLLKKKS